MKRTLLIICTLLCANVLLAQTQFTIDSLRYKVTSTNPAEVEVYYANPSIVIADIPETVTYEETTYSVTSIGGYAFRSRYSLTSFTIPNSVTSIGEETFRGCSSLTSITIPNSITSIGNSVFWNCSSLTSIDIPNSVTSIGYWVFRDCSSLTSITIPNSVTSIGGGVFYNCSSLTSVTLSNNITELPCHNDYDYYGFDYYYGFFQGCSSLTSVTIPNSVTSIGNNAFYDCSGLTSITLPESITSIASGAFNNCSFLQNITCLATTPPTLEDNTVFPYPNIATLTVPCGSLEAYSAPTSFWNMLFMGRIEEDCSGIEQAETESISFFPNPTSSKVSFNQTIEKVEVIDLSGKTLFTFSNANSINIESLPSGAYYLRLTNNDKAIMQKIIKE